jgi:3-deoxy-manno-octulosonate cytidylyltransferase (CMP-KDO synthetase)
VEHRGENPRKQVVAIIPARYESVRLPGKMLLPIGGKPLVLHTVERAGAAKLVDRVIVATDDERIFDVVYESGFEAMMTSADHRSGSDRIAEVAETLPEGTIVVNVQGDEPLIEPETIDRAVEKMLQADCDIVTVFEPLRSLHGELLNFNVVKVVTAEDGHALYFSRSPMPFPRDASLRWGGDPNRAIQNEPELFENFTKHVGLYVYSREFLLNYTKLPPTRLEQLESLEQLRALENGAQIYVVEAAGRSIGVDTQDDFDRVKDVIEAGIDIRHGNYEDMPRVAQVHVESWQRSFAGIAPGDYLNAMSVEKRLEVFRTRRCEENYEMFVAEHPEAGIVGFADLGTPVLAGGFDAQIFSFYFLPEFQRRGFGKRLFGRITERLRANGVKSLCLDSLELSPYRAFYEKHGGKVVGQDSHKLGDEEFATVIYGWEDISKL